MGSKDPSFLLLIENGRYLPAYHVYHGVVTEKWHLSILKYGTHCITHRGSGKEVYTHRFMECISFDTIELTKSVASARRAQKVRYNMYKVKQSVEEMRATIEMLKNRIRRYDDEIHEICQKIADDPSLENIKKWTYFCRVADNNRRNVCEVISEIASDIEDITGEPEDWTR